MNLQSKMFNTTPKFVQSIFRDDSDQVFPPQSNDVHHRVHGSIVSQEFLVRRAGFPAPGPRFATMSRKVKTFHREITFSSYVVTEMKLAG